MVLEGKNSILLRMLIAVVLIFCFVMMENPSLISRFADINIQTFYLGKSIVFVLSYFALFVALVLLSLSVSFWKYVFVIILVISTLYVDIFYRASGKVMEYIDFIILYQSKNNLFDALSMYSTEIAKSLSRSILLLLGFVIMPSMELSGCFRQVSTEGVSSLSNTLLRWGGGIICLLIVFSTVVCIYRQGAATNKLPSTINPPALSLAFLYDSLINPHPAFSYTTELKPFAKSQFTHIVLIVDESLRSDYSPFRRIEIPCSSALKVLDYGSAFSAANCSHTSNIALRKGFRSTEMANDFYSNAFIWSYAKNAGFITYLFDAQSGGMGHDFFTQDELKLVDHNISNTSILQDLDILQSLDYLDDVQRSFTYIIKKGSHFPYRAPQSFIDSASKMQLDSYTLSHKQRLLYLANVQYQSDEFFKALLAREYKQKVLFIYTSDHGQNLFDVPGLTHCTSSGDPYFGEGHVPLVILSNGDISRLDMHLEENYNRASHFNIVPTILEAMGYDVQSLLYIGTDSPLTEKIQPINGFFYGIPFSNFGKEPSFYRSENQAKTHFIMALEPNVSNRK